MTTKPKEKKEEKNDRQKRYEADVSDMVQNGGFTEKQAYYLLNWLNNYLPLY